MSASRVVTGLDCTGRVSPCPPNERRVRALDRPARGCCVIAFPRVPVGIRSCPCVRRAPREGVSSCKAPTADDPRDESYGKSLQSLAQTVPCPVNGPCTGLRDGRGEVTARVTVGRSCTFLLQGLSRRLHRCYVHVARRRQRRSRQVGRDGGRGRSLEHTGFHPQGELMRRGIAATALVASLALAATACGGRQRRQWQGGRPGHHHLVGHLQRHQRGADLQGPREGIREGQPGHQGQVRQRALRPGAEQVRHRRRLQGRPGHPALRGRLDPRVRQEGLLPAARRHRGPRGPGQVPAQPDRAGQVRRQDVRCAAGHRHPRARLQQGALQEGRHRRGARHLGRPEDRRRAPSRRRPASTATGAPPRPTTRSRSSTARAPTRSTPTPRRSPSPRPRPRRPTAPGRASSPARACTRPTPPPTRTPTSRTRSSTARSPRSSRAPGRSRTSTRARPSRTRPTSASPPSRPAPAARRAPRPAATTSPCTRARTRPTRRPR